MVQKPGELTPKNRYPSPIISKVRFCKGFNYSYIALGLLRTNKTTKRQQKTTKTYKKQHQTPNSLVFSLDLPSPTMNLCLQDPRHPKTFTRPAVTHLRFASRHFETFRAAYRLMRSGQSSAWKGASHKQMSSLGGRESVESVWHMILLFDHFDDKHHNN